MRLSKVALGVAVGISGASVVNAADVGLFPFTVVSPSVTTIVTIVDAGGETTQRYNQDGTPSDTGGYLHGRVMYKLRTQPNSAACDKNGEIYIPTNPGGVMTVDLGHHFSGDDGILFKGTAARDDEVSDEPFIDASGGAVSGPLVFHNSDDSINEEPGIDTDDFYSTRTTDEGRGTVYGEAMIFEYAGGAAWGYKTESKDGMTNNDPTDFSFTNRATKPWSIVTFMPPSEVITKLAIVPVDSGGGLFGQDGSLLPQSNQPEVTVGLRTKAESTITNVGTPGADQPEVGVAYNRNNEEIKGAVDVKVVCSGVVEVKNLMTSAAYEDLKDEGGYGLLYMVGPRTSATGRPASAIVYKVEYQDNTMTDPTFNGRDIKGVGTFNNGIKL